MPALAPAYRPRRPTETVLYGLVREHLETFLATMPCAQGFGSLRSTPQASAPVNATAPLAPVRPSRPDPSWAGAVLLSTLMATLV